MTQEMEVMIDGLEDVPPERELPTGQFIQVKILSASVYTKAETGRKSFSVRFLPVEVDPDKPYVPESCFLTIPTRDMMDKADAGDEPMEYQVRLAKQNLAEFMEEFQIPMNGTYQPAEWKGLTGRIKVSMRARKDKETKQAIYDENGELVQDRQVNFPRRIAQG